MPHASRLIFISTILVTAHVTTAHADAWQSRLGFGYGANVIAASNGDPFAISWNFGQDLTTTDLVRLSAADGSTSWRLDVAGFRAGFATDASDNLVVTGCLQPTSVTQTPIVTKYDGATGAVLWNTSLGADGCAGAVRKDGDGNFIVAANVASTGTVVKLDGSTGAVVLSPQNPRTPG
jgi:hypothetical protein